MIVIHIYNYPTVVAVDRKEQANMLLEKGMLIRVGIDGAVQKDAFLYFDWIFFPFQSLNVIGYKIA